MRAVVSRVANARVVVDGAVVGAIGQGLLVLVGVAQGDGAIDASWLADKLVGLRIFADDAGQMHRSVAETGGAVLVVSQFTLYGDARRGRRPSFVAAARPAEAEPLVQAVADAVAARGVPVATGRFGADMLVESVGDGPVTILLESPPAL